MELSPIEKKLIMLLRGADQHDRFEVIKIKDGEFVIKKTQKIKLEDLYKDQNML